jgi:hypothetical protein
MTATQTAKLDALRNYGTRYEVVITNGADTLLVGYTGRKSRDGMIALIRLHGERLVAFSGSEEFTTGKRADDAITLGKYKIRFSGRTQREAISATEYNRIP